MAEAIRTAVHATIARILEDWAMMMVDHEPQAAEHFDPDLPYYVAVIQFHGIVGGRYRLLCQTPFAEQLTRSLLGIDDEVTAEQMIDALKEMINVLTGNLLTETYGEDTVFTLTPPEAHLATAEELEMFRSPRTFSYLADSLPIQIHFVLEGLHVDQSSYR